MLKSPGIETPEKVQSTGGSGAPKGTRAAYVGIAVKGPVGTAVECRSLKQFVDTFGAGTVGKLRAAADALWAAGNAPGAVGYFVRTAHYTDPAAPATLTAVKATKTLQDRNGIPANTAKVDAVNEGTWGDKLKVRIADGPADTANKFQVEVLETVDGTDLVRETFKDLTVAGAEAAINGKSKYITWDDLGSATASPNNRPATGTFSLAGGNDGLTGLVDADYVGSSAGKTGLYALNQVSGRLLATVPGVATIAVQSALLGWCESRGNAYAVLDCPDGYTENQAKTYRETTLAANSSYGELWWPNLKVNGVEVPVSPYRIAAMIRTDEEVGGAHQVASGAVYGKFYGYTEPASLAYRDVTVRDLLDQAQVNTLNEVDGAVVFWGANTLDKTGTFPYSNERRVFQYARDVVQARVLLDVFRNNDEALWKSITRKVRDILLPIWRAGGLRGASEAEAFDIKIDTETNPQEVVDAGEVRGQVGLATQKPGLFFYFDFYRKAGQ